MTFSASLGGIISKFQDSGLQPFEVSRLLTSSHAEHPLLHLGATNEVSVASILNTWQYPLPDQRGYDVVNIQMRALGDRGSYNSKIRHTAGGCRNVAENCMLQRSNGEVRPIILAIFRL